MVKTIAATEVEMIARGATKEAEDRGVETKEGIIDLP